MRILGATQSRVFEGVTHVVDINEALNVEFVDPQPREANVVLKS